MKILALCFLLTGCATIPTQQPVDSATIAARMQDAAALSGQPLVTQLPRVYLVFDVFEFRRLTCGDACGFTTADATYADRTIYINYSRLKGSPDALLVHELVHYLQHMAHDSRTCRELETEAYRAQFSFARQQPLVSIAQHAADSCEAL